MKKSPLNIVLHNQDGQALVELAMIAPILLFVIVAIISLTEAGQKKTMVARAAAAAARVAIVRPDLAEQEALSVLRSTDPTIRAGDVQVTVKPAKNSPIPFTAPMRVSVVLNYRPVSGFGWRPTFRLKSNFVSDKWSNGVWLNVSGFDGQ